MKGVVILANAEDLQGIVFGELTVIRRNGSNKQNRAMWLCKCSCGKEKTIASHDLKHGTVSCGHIAAEVRRENFMKGWERNRINGLESKKKKLENKKPKLRKQHKRLSSIFNGMRSRCYFPNHMHYENYGGRGIKISKDWLNNYFDFEDWALKSGYADNLSIDRIDNDGDYTPNNCRWATAITQMNNRRNNHHVEIEGETKTIAQWCREYNLNWTTFRQRLDSGKEGKELLQPVEGDNNG